MILDTNAVSSLIGREREILEVVPEGSPTYLPVVVVGEYRAGVLRSHIREELEVQFGGLLAKSVVLETTLETAHRYAKIMAGLMRAGTPIPTNDVWIAALAQQYSLWIVSNDAHFDHVKGVNRISW